MSQTTRVEILNKDLERVAEVRSLYPLTESGTVLRYSKELSDYGTCEFRIANEDPIFNNFGDIIEPHRYHVRIKRNNYTAWQGPIVDNPERGRNFFAVKAKEPLFYLDKILVKRTSKVSYGEFEPDDNIGLHYRIFQSGTMATAVTNVVNEAKAKLGGNHLINALTLGTIENPNYPSNFVNSDGNKMTGGWTFNDDVVLQFDYHSVLYVLKAFGIYADADFQVTSDLKFNFKKFLGNKNTNLKFVYDSGGNIVDYDLPRFGERMVNDLIGIASSPEGTVLHNTNRDEASIKKYGLMEKAVPYTDVKNKNALNARLAKEMRFLKNPEEAPINLVLSEKAYPLGQFDVGDLVTVRIKDKTIDFTGTRRVAGYTVTMHNTGRELIAVQTNVPNPEDTGKS